MTSCEESDRANTGLSGDAIDQCRQPAEDAYRATGGERTPGNVATYANTLIEGIHSFSLRVNVADPKFIEHLVLGQAFLTSAMDLALEQDAPSF